MDAVKTFINKLEKSKYLENKSVAIGVSVVLILLAVASLVSSSYLGKKTAEKDAETKEYKMSTVTRLFYNLFSLILVFVGIFFFVLGALIMFTKLGDTNLRISV